MTVEVIVVVILIGVLAFLLGRATKHTETERQIPQLQAELQATQAKLAEQAEIEQSLLAKFQVVAAQAVVDSNSLFMEAAASRIEPLIDRATTDFAYSKETVSQLVQPLSEELKRIETARAESQGALKQQLTDLAGHNQVLVQETRNLSNALKRPEGRGAWGEMQLRRVVELAGMSEHCDFEEQVSVELAAGSRERPDMVVNLPNGRTIIVDAKAPIKAYLDALEARSDQDREEALDRVARQVGDRARELARKSYWNSFAQTPDFVVMFLPGEFLLPVALERHPGLMDQIMEQNVVIATPNTLIALLKTVAMGWREVTLAQEAAEIGRLGQELHDKLFTFASHMEKTRTALQSTLTHFNRSVASLDGRNSVMDHARKFKELGISTSKEIPVLDGIAMAEVRELDITH